MKYHTYRLYSIVKPLILLTIISSCSDNVLPSPSQEKIGNLKDIESINSPFSQQNITDYSSLYEQKTASNDINEKINKLFTNQNSVTHSSNSLLSKGVKNGGLTALSTKPGNSSIYGDDSTILTSSEATQANQNYQQKVSNGSITAQSLNDPYDGLHAKVWVISRIKYRWWFVGRSDVIRFEKSMVRRNATNSNDKFPVSFYVVPNSVWNSYGNSDYAAYAFSTDYGCELYFKQDYVVRDAKTINTYGATNYRSTLDNGLDDVSNQSYWSFALDTLAHEMGHCMDFMANGNFLFGIPIGANHSGFSRTDLTQQTYGNYFANPYEAYAQIFSENYKSKCGAYNIDLLRDETYVNVLTNAHGCPTLSLYYYNYKVRDFIATTVQQNNQPSLVRTSNTRPLITTASLSLYSYNLKNILGSSLTAKPIISQPPYIQ